MAYITDHRSPEKTSQAKLGKARFWENNETYLGSCSPSNPRQTCLVITYAYYNSILPSSFAPIVSSLSPACSTPLYRCDGSGTVCTGYDTIPYWYYIVITCDYCTWGRRGGLGRGRKGPKGLTRRGDRRGGAGDERKSQEFYL